MLRQKLDRGTRAELGRRGVGCGVGWREMIWGEGRGVPGRGVRAGGCGKHQARGRGGVGKGWWWWL